MNELPTSTAMEQLHADLSALRGFVAALRVQEDEAATQTPSPTARGGGSGDGGATTQSDSRGSTEKVHGAPSVPVTDPLSQLRDELQTTTASLHAERAAAAQLRIQQRCDAATIHRMTEQMDAADSQRAAAEAERDDWRRQAALAAERATNCESGADPAIVVQALVAALRERVAEMETVHGELKRGVAAAEKVITELSEENARLQRLERVRRAELLQLRAAEVEAKVVQQRLHDALAQQDEWVAAMSTVANYMEGMKADYEDGLRLLVARQEDHAQLQAALAQREAQCVQWEKLFHECGHTGLQRETPTVGAVVVAVTERDVGTSSASALLKEHVYSAEQEEEEDSTSEGSGTARTTANTAAATAAAAAVGPVFAQQLEAKVADLAVELFAAQARATAAEERLRQLSLLTLTDAAVVAELTATLGVLRPQVAMLAADNAALQARLLAAESVTEPLMEHVISLAEAYTGEVCRCWGERSAAGTRSGGSSGEDAAADPVQRLGRSAEEEVPGPGKRHRLRPAALLSRRMD